MNLFTPYIQSLYKKYVSTFDVVSDFAVGIMPEDQSHRYSVS